MFNEYPYLNVNDFNLDYMLKRLHVIEEIVENFVKFESVKFADPIEWNITRQYAKNTIVLDENGNAFLSKQPVPSGVQLNNEDYWLEVFNFMSYVKSFNSNLTLRVERDTTQATQPLHVNDWLIYNDILYKVLVEMQIGDDFIIGTNIERFTVEEFIKAFIQYATNLIQQYKNDIDASELAYKQSLANDIYNITQSLQSQLDQALAGVTVDSEVINARVGENYVTYSTLKNALDGQFSEAKHGFGAFGNSPVIQFERGSIDGSTGANNNWDYESRVRSVNVICLDYPITFYTDGGVEFFIHSYRADGSYIGPYGSWQTEVTIESNTPFRLLASSNSSPRATDFNTIISHVKYAINYNSDKARFINEGEVLIPIFFEHGSLDANGDNADYHNQNRIRTKEWLISHCDITVKTPPASGGAVFYYKDNGTVYSSGWITDHKYTVKAGQEFRILATQNIQTEVPTTIENIVLLMSYGDYSGEGEPFSVLDNQHRLLHDGELLVPALFERGSLDSNGANVDWYNNARIRTTDWLVSQRDITLRSALGEGGFSLYYREGGVVTWLGWIANGKTHTIKAGTEFRLLLSLTRNTDTFATENEILSGFSYAYSDVIPPYYFENDYLNSKMATITNRYEDTNKLLTFGWISDVHIGVNAGQSMKLMKYIDDHSNSVPFVLFCGDIPGDTTTEDSMREQAREWVNMMNDYDKERVLQCRGNHDFEEYSPSLGQTIYLKNNVAYKYCTKNQILASNGDNFYYYYDVPDNTNTRIIILDAYASTGTNGDTINTLTQAEITWFINAINVNKNVIVALHCPIDPDLPYYVPQMEPIMTIVTAFKTHSAVNRVISGLTVNCDFTNNSGTFICVFNGHIHEDNSHVTSDGVLSIAINCDGNAISTSGYDRTAGTVNEQCFDIVSIDTTNRIIYLTRIGAGSDRQFSY